MTSERSSVIIKGCVQQMSDLHSFIYGVSAGFHSMKAIKLESIRTPNETQAPSSLNTQLEYKGTP